MSWNGPYDLTQDNVGKLKSQPGAYIIGYSRDGAIYGAYVGRSDDDLKGRLRDHLPANETNECIKRLGCDRFWYQYADSAKAAYDIECTTYHKQNGGYSCNVNHPAKSNSNWKCPVCGE